MDRDIDTLTLLLMDPFLTRDEAEREAAAVGGSGRDSSESRQDWRTHAEYLPGHNSHTPGRNHS
jgi:hypothetical protein